MPRYRGGSSSPHRRCGGSWNRSFPRRPAFPGADLPSAAPGDLLTDLSGRLQGFDLLYLDLASERAQAAGVHVVKAVVPGLEVETVSSGRVGARNLQRLLARAGTLVGLGDPPPMGVPIRLSEVARALRSLYPLYRESGRHPAPVWFGNP